MSPTEGRLARWRAALVRRLKRLLVVAIVLGAAYALYRASFDPEAEDWPGQRAALSARDVQDWPTTLAREPLLADVRELASPRYGGRAVGSEGGAAARDYLVARLRAIGVAPLGADFRHPFTFKRRRVRQFWTGGIDTPGVNLLGRIDGRERGDRWLVLSAHYDHLGTRGGQMFPGADDNASGVAAVLAMADYFVKHPPRHGIVLALFDGEEAGLAGARQFVADPPVPLASVRLNLNLDMVSRSSDGELFVVGTWQYPTLKSWVDPLRAHAPILLLYGHDRPRPFGDPDDWGHASDHGPFHDAGVPFLYLGVPDHPDYHRPTDTYAAIDPAFFHNAAQAALNIALAADAGD